MSIRYQLNISLAKSILSNSAAIHSSLNNTQLSTAHLLAQAVRNNYADANLYLHFTPQEVEYLMGVLKDDTTEASLLPTKTDHDDFNEDDSSQYAGSLQSDMHVSPDTDTSANFVTEEEEQEVDHPKELSSSESNNISAEHTIKLDLPDLNAPVTETEVNFEPLHTSDYFASQGIKISAQMLDDDRFGKQLKSFTQWLQTIKMQKLQQPNAANAAADEQIAGHADKSNADVEIVTETMAEAYKLQQKPAKAKLIYEKLSLQNPAKSSYFAAKIAELNAEEHPAQNN